MENYFSKKCEIENYTKHEHLNKSIENIELTKNFKHQNILIFTDL
jgi:hypothetical protein